MPMYRYWCPGCGNEAREFHMMDDRHQDCDCGTPFSIVPQRVQVIHDRDWQEGRLGDPLDLTPALGPDKDGKRRLATGRRTQADMMKRRREEYYNETGIDLGELHIHGTDQPKGKNTPMSVFDSSVPFGKDNETVEEFNKRMGV
jgi:hypothetical protein